MIDIPLHRPCPVAASDSKAVSQNLIDLDALSRLATEVKPAAIVLGGSMPMHQLPVADVRRIADGVGSLLMYDGAHVTGP